MARILVAMVAAAVLAVAGWLFFGRNSSAPATAKPSASNPATIPTPEVEWSPGVTIPQADKQSNDSKPALGTAVSIDQQNNQASEVVISSKWKLYQSINDKNSTAQKDVELLSGLMREYHGTLQKLPYGGNKEYTRALTGKNKLKQAFLPPNHVAISENGELIDRWGTPYFIHPLYEGIVQFRSGGPDQQLWTDDDVHSAIPDWLQQLLEQK